LRVAGADQRVLKKFKHAATPGEAAEQEEKKK